VPLTSAAASADATRPRPTSVAPSATGPCSAASARNSGSAEPAAMAATVSARIQPVCARTASGSVPKRSVAAKPDKVSR